MFVTMDSLSTWTPYISLFTFVALMLLGSLAGIQQLVVFFAGASIPVGLHCLKLESQNRKNRR